ncbi:ankyrin, partial [Acephala macrosclerotiorum]
GFESFDRVRDALNILLKFQPGHEDEVLWSAVRHDHKLLVKIEIIEYLLSRGADPKVRTERRGLTCLHLLMLVVRDLKTDRRIWELISGRGIEVDAKETVDGLTAFHLAVRNQKLDFVRALLDMGADSEIPVADQLNILSQGKTGFLEYTPNPPLAFSSQLTIIGEVVIQYIQDNFYHPDYVANLLFLLLDRKPQPLSLSDLIDPPNKTTLLHLFAVLDEGPQPPRKRHEAIKGPPVDPIHTATASLLQLTLLRCHLSTINAQDAQGDTPLHFACAAHQLHAIRALLSSGADPTIKNKLGLRPLDVLVWSVFFLGGNTL